MDLYSRANRIRLFLMDVDGVMTDGRLFQVPDAAGAMVETKAFYTHDGVALLWLKKFEIATGLISGRISPATVERARQCGMKYVYQGSVDKEPIFEEILRAGGFACEEVAYAGDDLPDLPIMRRAALAVAPADARPEVREAAHLVTGSPGGRGAIREAVELILQAKGLWPKVLAQCGKISA